MKQKDVDRKYKMENTELPISKPFLQRHDDRHYHSIATERLFHLKCLNDDENVLYGLGVGLKDASHAKTWMSHILFPILGEPETIDIICNSLMEKSQECIIQFIDNFRGLSESARQTYGTEFAKKSKAEGVVVSIDFTSE